MIKLTLVKGWLLFVVKVGLGHGIHGVPLDGVETSIRTGVGVGIG
jgi:hypothetical protein